VKSPSSVPAFFYKAGFRKWPEHLVDKYVGPYQQVLSSHAADKELRQKAASGGTVSALLIHLLDAGVVDGALVVDTVIEGGWARAKYAIAQSREAVLNARGSKYSAVHFSAEALPLLRRFPGRIAVVALPCDSYALHRVRQLDSDLDQKVRLVITLLCGHNSEPALTDMVISKLGSGHGQLVDLHWRSGHWRGQLTAAFQDGTNVAVPFPVFSKYRNLYFFAQPKCHHCYDHYGYYGDVSAGDIWSLKARKEPIKQTGLIVRTAAGCDAVNAAVAAKALVVRAESIDEILTGQSRTMPFHYNVTARARLAPLFGFRINDRVHERVRLIDYPVAFTCLLNERISRTKWGRRLIKAMPAPIVRAYVYVFKALELL
jgi:coenzyme F420-reducing hydrogenase beta subunit